MAEATARAGVARLSPMLRPGPLVLAALLLGCQGNEEIPPCEAAPECPVVDEEPAEGDLTLSFGESTQSLDLFLNGFSTPLEVLSGELVLTPDPEDPDCQGRCAVVLKRLRFTLADLFLVSYEDALEVTGLEVALRAPLELAGEEGTGHALEAGAALRSCATVDGRLMTTTTVLESAQPLELDAAEPAAIVSIGFPIQILGSTYYGCELFDLTIEGSLRGAPE